MKRTNKSLIGLISFCILLFFVGNVFAEDRPIYVGDLIQLQIEKNNLTLEEINNAFSEFEVVDIEETDTQYLLTIRSFEPGLKEVDLLGQKLQIDIGSTLDTIDREIVYESQMTVEPSGLSIYWNYIFFGLILVFAFSTGYIVNKKIRKKQKPLSAYELLQTKISGLNMASTEYLYELTGFFVDYMESILNLILKGQTSAEIMNILRNQEDCQDIYGEINEWFTDIQYQKFSGIQVNESKKQEFSEKLIKMADFIQMKMTSKSEIKQITDSEVV